MKNLIFLAGVHGAGKNFVLNQFSLQDSIVCLTASDVLGWRKINQSPNDKKVVSICDMQTLLIKNLKKILERDKHYILNGHLTLLNQKEEIERIPENVFLQINPKALIVKTARPQSIYTRLKQRDKKKWAINKITLMQKEEIAYAKEIALKLHIPFYQVHDGQEKFFTSIIDEELRHG